MIKVYSEPLSKGDIIKSNFYFNNPNVGVTQGDPFFNNVVLYIKGDGENNSTNIIDSSPTPKTITISGDAKISTEQSKYGGSSLKFINFAGGTDYLDINDTSLNVSTSNGDFTLEAWLYYTDSFTSTTPFGWEINPLFYMYFSKIYFRETYTDIIPFVSASFAVNQWEHWAITREGTTYRLFKNGILLSSGIKSTLVSGNIFIVGKNTNANGGGFMRGYIDSLRITKACRYIFNFDPETDTYLAY